MHWLNIETATLDSEEFRSAAPVDQATWLKLLRYCIGQENGGVIRGAKSWVDRKWQSVVGTSGKEVRHECLLWAWGGDDLEVTFYPHDKEMEVQAKRAAAKSTHAKRAAERVAEHGAHPAAEQSAEHPEKGREGKEKEMEGKEGAPSSRNDPGQGGGIPTLDECLQWGQRAGVAEGWIRAKYVNTTGAHGWVRNGRLIDWQVLWKAWFEEDRTSGGRQKNPAPRADADRNDGLPPPPGESAVDFNKMRL